MRKIKEVIKAIEDLDRGMMEKAQKKLDFLTKPQGSLGRLEELAKQLTGIKRTFDIKLKNKVIFTFASDHGIAEEGVSAFPQEVTAQMVYNFISGGAGINVLARHVKARVVVADLGVKETLKTESKNLKIKKIGFGTKNFAKTKAMTKKQAQLSIAAGIEIFEEEFSAKGRSAPGEEKGIDIAGIGEMGIANTTPASAIAAAITGAKVRDITGRGTGINDKALKHKIKIIEKALLLHKPDKDDAIDVLSKVGGFEIGGLAGVILAAASRKVPVVVDGFISTAAALIAYKLEPKTAQYMISAHSSVEKGHKIMLKYMNLRPLLNLDLRLGEGTGAALAMSLVEAGVKIMNEMATFENAGVSNKE
ncbi:MAG: nicotinate-nucleotide--dimethylbenzimidazole phosphoribosyltransferase [Candidatus Omnitrophica bacterium]|nr:nicotinate-nucleotide--dimethylbenzimidazole phosphoribosyltransferase [Candidatus Omnitrophota bacterium]